MNYQKILENLSELEEAFYYASDAEDRLNMTYEEMHDLMKKALLLWGEYTSAGKIPASCKEGKATCLWSISKAQTTSTTAL